MAMLSPLNNRWNVRKVLSPILVFSDILGITIGYKKRAKILTYAHQLLIFGLLIATFIHEIPSIQYWHEHSEGTFVMTALKNSDINSVIDKLQNSSFSLSGADHLKIFKYGVAHIVVNLAAIIIYNILGHDVVWPNLNYTPFTSTLYIFVDLICLVCVFQFVLMINFISEVFKQINKKLKQFKKKVNSDLGPENEIIKLRELHLFLSRTCAEVNNCFSTQLLFVIFLSMIQVIYALRSITGNFAIQDVEESLLNITADIFWFLPFFIILIQLIVFSEKTATQGRKSIIVVHNLINLYYCDNEMLRELEIFAMQIQQHPIVFNVRFFDLDYPFLNTMISALATYFVIFVTFQGETDNGIPVDWRFKAPTTTAATETTS